MNSVVLIIVAICVLSLAYRYYAAFIAARVIVLKNSNVTPAKEFADGRDFIPTNKWLLFGHHFAAIAGAGPLIGPVLAAQFGWSPAFFWILLGSVFAGGVQDMIILFASVRHSGKSLADIAREEVGSVTGLITIVLSFFVIIVTLAGVGITVVNTLYNNPWGLFSIAMTIPIAILFGLYTFCCKNSSILLGSIVSVTLISVAVFAGPYLLSSGLGEWFVFTRNELSIMLPTYALFAAVLPMWLLLTPRGYLSTYMKIGVILIMAVGLLIAMPTIKMPAVTQFMSGSGPIINGPWWPYMFITIACGAISGFHALIGTGTTSKLVAKEGDIPMIGYGAMLAEAFVSIMALVAVITLAPEDYFAINSSKESFSALNMSVVELPRLSQVIGLDVMNRPGGAVSLAVGMANIFAHMADWLNGTMKYWFQFVIMFEALFILTLIDTGTRVARYILQNILNDACPTLKKRENCIFYAIITSVLVSAGWGYLLYTGDIKSIWPLFGAANQALAALVLAIGTTVILKTAKRRSYALVTAVPGAFVYVTSMAACVLNIQMFYGNKQFLNAGLSVALIMMITVAVAESAKGWMRIAGEQAT